VGKSFRRKLTPVFKWHNIFRVSKKYVMKPQQQDTVAKKESAVFVQTPKGGTVNIKTDHSLPEAKEEGKADQSAEHTPTKSSGEVTSGEAG
jgi:hypothetical protein